MKPGRTLALTLLIGCTLGLIVLTSREKPADIPAPAKTVTSSEHLMNMIKESGVRQTARELDKAHDWSQVRKVITTGQDNTREVVAALLPLADQATNRSLLQTARYNLPRHPVQILSASEYTDATPGGAFRLEGLCNAAGMSHAWQNRTREALSNLQDVRLASRVNDCLNALRQSNHNSF